MLRTWCCINECFNALGQACERLTAFHWRIPQQEDEMRKMVLPKMLLVTCCLKKHSVYRTLETLCAWPMMRDVLLFCKFGGRNSSILLLLSLGVNYLRCRNYARRQKLKQKTSRYEHLVWISLNDQVFWKNSKNLWQVAKLVENALKLPKVPPHR